MGAISCGEFHTLWIQDDGSVASFGKGTFGRLGQGSEQNSSSARAIRFPEGHGPARRIVGVAAGSSHSLALDEEGMVYSWGKSSDGQLAQANIDGASVVPVPAYLLRDGTGSPWIKATAVAAGGEMSAAIESGGRLWLWGKCQWSSSPGPARAWARPVAVPREAFNGMSVLAVACGGGHILASCCPVEGGADGERWLFSWGENNDGQLGHGDKAPRSTPAPVEALSKQDVPLLAAGGAHSVVAVRAGEGRRALWGGVWTWGLNSNGQLGDGGRLSASYPQHVDGLPRGGDVRAVAAGAHHTCVVLAPPGAPGELWAWGREDARGSCGKFAADDMVRPGRVGQSPQGDGDPLAVACGVSHTVALVAQVGGSGVLAWGSGRHGVLGAGGEGEQWDPWPVVVDSSPPAPVPAHTPAPAPAPAAPAAAAPPMDAAPPPVHPAPAPVTSPEADNPPPALLTELPPPAPAAAVAAPPAAAPEPPAPVATAAPAAAPPPAAAPEPPAPVAAPAPAAAPPPAAAPEPPAPVAAPVPAAAPPPAAAPEPPEPSSPPRPPRVPAGAFDPSALSPNAAAAAAGELALLAGADPNIAAMVAAIALDNTLTDHDLEALEAALLAMREGDANDKVGQAVTSHAVDEPPVDGGLERTSSAMDDAPVALHAAGAGGGGGAGAGPTSHPLLNSDSAVDLVAMGEGGEGAGEAPEILSPPSSVGEGGGEDLPPPPSLIERISQPVTVEAAEEGAAAVAAAGAGGSEGEGRSERERAADIGAEVLAAAAAAAAAAASAVAALTPAPPPVDSRAAAAAALHGPMVLESAVAQLDRLDAEGGGSTPAPQTPLTPAPHTPAGKLAASISGRRDPLAISTVRALLAENRALRGEVGASQARLAALEAMLRPGGQGEQAEWLKQASREELEGMDAWHRASLRSIEEALLRAEGPEPRSRG